MCVLWCIVDDVSGVTHLGDIVYVIWVQSSTISLYNTDTFSALDVINVDGMDNPCDIVVCRDDRQLYIADKIHVIWQVSVDDHTSVKWLSTTSDALSLTSRRLLVTSQWSFTLHLYGTPDGQLLHAVELPMYVNFLYHSVETTHGSFLVSHRGTAESESLEAVSFVKCFLVM